MQELQLFAWQSAARGNDVHLNANPTQGQLLHQAYKEKKEELRDSSKVSVLARYGGEQYLETAPKELLQGQTEEYVEYSRAGQVIHGKERAKARSKYPEDGSSCIHTYICHKPLNVFAFSQFTSTTTRLCGDRGMIQRQVHGAMRVVTQSCISHTALVMLGSTLPQRRAHRICSCRTAHNRMIRRRSLQVVVVRTKGSSGRQTSTSRRSRAGYQKSVNAKPRQMRVMSDSTKNQRRRRLLRVRSLTSRRRNSVRKLILLK